MSHLTVIVRDKGISTTRLHYRDVIKSVMDNNFQAIKSDQQVPVAPFDGGIILVDIPSRIILSFQCCFIPCEIPGWTVIDFINGEDLFNSCMRFRIKLERMGINSEDDAGWFQFIKNIWLAGVDLDDVAILDDMT